MNPLQTTALQRALQLLAAAGVRYCVLTEDGQKFGTIEPAPEPAPDTKRVRRFNHRHKFDYLERIKSAKVGETIEYLCESKDEAKSLAGTMAACLGPGASFTKHGQRADGAYYASCLVVVPLSAADQPAGQAPAQMGMLQ